MLFFKNNLVKKHFMWGHPSCRGFLPFSPSQVALSDFWIGGVYASSTSGQSGASCVLSQGRDEVGTLPPSVMGPRG